LTHYPDLWAAGVDIVGISHFRTFLENTGEWRRKLREVEYGYLGEDDDFFEEIAPLNHSAKIKAPLLVFHGRNDTRVPVSEAEQLVADMQGRGQQVSLHVFEDEGHFTEKLANHITLNQSITQFFLQHLQPSHSEKE
ncbi:alpha/beta hydrolase family protein, partial [Brevibacillus agri]